MELMREMREREREHQENDTFSHCDDARFHENAIKFEIYEKTVNFKLHIICYRL